MIKTLRILTVLSLAASSILFATPSQAAVIGGVTVTTAGNISATTLSANSIYYTSNGGSEGVSNKVIFDIAGRQFSFANLSEASFTSSQFSDTNRIGIPAIPVTNYDITINMNMGYAYLARGSIYVDGTAVLENFYPSYNYSGFCMMSCGTVQTRRPFIQLNYKISTGQVTVRVPITTSSSTQTFINSDGTFTVTDGTISSWSEVTIFAIGAPSTTVPGAPTSVTATSTGATTANVSFTAPTSDGGATITSYTATSSPGGITGTISQAGSGTIAITGLTADVGYKFTVKARNSAGDSVASSASNAVGGAFISDGTTLNSQLATIPSGIFKAKIPATAALPGLTLNFGGSVPNDVTVTPVANPASSAATPFKIFASTKIVDIQLSGPFTGSATVCIDGNSTDDLFHYSGVAWDRLPSRTVSNGQVCGVTTSFSPFVAAPRILIPASITSLSFVDDGTGTGGKIVWAGKSIDAVLFTGPTSAYPAPYNYGAFTSGWNGRIRNLTPDTSYTISIYAISVDGVGESKSVTFKTSATLPALVGAASSTAAQTSETKLSQMMNWVNENTFNPGEATNMMNLLSKFMALETSPHRSHIKVPTSRVSTVVATSLTPSACSVVSATAKVDAGVVKALSTDTCTISYTVTGGSKAPATMVKDFVFEKIAK